MELEAAAAGLMRASEEGELTSALDDLYRLLRSDPIEEEYSVYLASLLIPRLNSPEKDNRLKILSLLRTIASANDTSKEKMAEMGSLSLIVQSLMREKEERREAAGLLSDLVGVVSLCQRLGRIHGCVMILVTLLEEEDEVSAAHAKNVLEFLSSHGQNALLMAESGYFSPMIKYLKRGSNMNKILMATAISRMEMTDKEKSLLGESAIKALTELFLSGNLESKLSSLSAIKSLCSCPANVEHVIASGLPAHLLHLLYSVTSAVTSLQEPAAAILSLISHSPSILTNGFLPRVLSLLTTSNNTVKTHLLHALDHVTGQPGSIKSKQTVRKSGAVDFLLTLISEDQTLRATAISVIFKLSKDLNLTKYLTLPHLNLFIKIIKESDNSDEISSSCGILSNIPLEDKTLTSALLRANSLSRILSLIKDNTHLPSLMENAVGVLVRFTAPGDVKLQRKVAELGAINELVKLVSKKEASSIAKSRAALCLAQLSKNSTKLSDSRERDRWAACVSTAEKKCEIHGGGCSIRATFCLERAGAVRPLMAMVKESSDKAAMEALATLLPGGSGVLEREMGVEVMVGVAEREMGEEREMAMRILEGMMGDDGVRERCGRRVQGLVVGIVREGIDGEVRAMVGRILELLGVLPKHPSGYG